MHVFRWLDVKSKHPGAYRAERVDQGEYRTEVVWTLHPGLKQHHHVTASLTKEGGSLWRVEKKFMRYPKAFNFFERMREQAEDRLTQLSGAD